jgi:hypothetical protein
MTEEEHCGRTVRIDQESRFALTRISENASSPSGRGVR